MNIALDAMGGDFAPENPVEGAVLAAREHDLKILLVGDEHRIKQELEKHKIHGLRLEIVHASEVITMEDKVEAMRNKRDSSLRVCARLVKEGQAGCMVSAGHTGAAMAIAKIVFGSLDKVKRPALALAVPTITGKPAVFLDAGANVLCSSENLVQFAIMGNTYSRDILGYENPRVGVLSNGEEATKGNDIVRDTVERLKQTDLNFIGPVEGKDLFNGFCDVVVTDGFTGNAVLKAAEGIAELGYKVLKQELTSSWYNRLVASLLIRAFRRYKKRFDYSEYGGAPLLGLNGVCTIAHGRSNPVAIKNSIRVAAEFVQNNAVAHIQRGISDLYKDKIL